MNVIRNVLRDVYLLITNFHLLFYIRKINDEDRPFLRELIPSFKNLVPRQKWYQKLALVTIPRTWPVRRRPVIIETNAAYTEGDYKFIFVNGILTSEDKMDMYLTAISRVFKTNVTGIYNPSDGAPVDLIETAFSRTFDASAKVVEKTEEIVYDMILNNPSRTIVLMGHSQGGLIVTEVVKRLADRFPSAGWFNRLEVYTFGSAADDLDLSNLEVKPHVEHFINDKDFVASIGTKANAHMVYGDVKIADRTGHSFHGHYLPGVLSKQYGETRLLNVYKNRLASNIPTTRYLVEEGNHDFNS